MKNVSLSIGGRDYRVACAAGEEAHIARLGAMIDRKLLQMPGLANQSEQRMLLYAALLLADEVHELQRASRQDPADAEALEQVARVLESVAARLEGDHKAAQ